MDPNCWKDSLSHGAFCPHDLFPDSSVGSLAVIPIRNYSPERFRDLPLSSERVKSRTGVFIRLCHTLRYISSSLFNVRISGWSSLGS